MFVGMNPYGCSKTHSTYRIKFWNLNTTRTIKAYIVFQLEIGIYLEQSIHIYRMIIKGYTSEKWHAVPKEISTEHKLYKIQYCFMQFNLLT